MKLSKGSQMQSKVERKRNIGPLKELTRPSRVAKLAGKLQNCFANKKQKRKQEPRHSLLASGQRREMAIQPQLRLQARRANSVCRRCVDIVDVVAAKLSKRVCCRFSALAICASVASSHWLTRRL